MWFRMLVLFHQLALFIPYKMYYNKDTQISVLVGFRLAHAELCFPHNFATPVQHMLYTYIK